MRLHIVLNLPGRNGAPTQFVICDHDAETIQAFVAELNDNDHIVVHQLDTVGGDLLPGAFIGLNQNIVAKTTPYQPRYAR
jgi:hypothetical protein